MMAMVPWLCLAVKPAANSMTFGKSCPVCAPARR